jgi:short-subunit dehydrogenase
MKKVVLITGASSGMGKATAILLNAQGYKVYAVARRVGNMKELEALDIKTAFMDITDDDSIDAVVTSILHTEGRLDILINNAGFGLYGAFEEVSIQEARRQLDVNLIGLARLTQVVIPVMRNQKSGKIINISSIGGKMVGPFGAWYHVSKFGVEALSDALRLELKPFGIDVIVIQPGGIQSEWSGIAMNNLKSTAHDNIYESAIMKVLSSNEKLEKQYSNPAVIARLILKAIQSKRPKTRYNGGYMAGFILFIRRIVPDRIIDKMIMSKIS